MKTKENISRRPEVAIALVLLANGRLRLSGRKDIVVGVLRDVDRVLIIGASELRPGVPGTVRSGRVAWDRFRTQAYSQIVLELPLSQPPLPYLLLIHSSERSPRQIHTVTIHSSQST